MASDIDAPAPSAPASTGAAGARWVILADGVDRAPSAAPGAMTPRRVLVWLIAGLAAVLVVVGLLGAFAAQLLAEREAVNDAANTADVLAEAVIQPALTDALAEGEASAVSDFDAIIRERVLGPGIVRVKIWAPDGTVLYADEPQLIGRTFALGDDQLAALADPQTRAEVSDLTASENEFEPGDSLLEVYRPVWTPDGTELLFEMYSPYAPVASRSADLWRGFAGVTASTLLLFVVLTAPILWNLLRRLRDGEAQRAELLQRAVDASEAERRRIAGSLHDGPVQELVATTYAAEGAAASADARDEGALAGQVRAVASSVRGNIRALRTLLVDIYPASLASSGLPQALSDLADTARRRRVDVRVDLDADLPTLSHDDDRLVYRVAQECLRNAAAHAAPCTAVVRLASDDGDVVLEIADDGPGFDAERLRHPESGHVGTRVLVDLVGEADARLDVRTEPGEGTSWRLTLPARAVAGSRR